MTRTELLEQYSALPLPTTKDEHWRFTDLKGFDPDAWIDGGAGVAAAPSMLDLDVAEASVSESGIEIESAPEGCASSRFPTTTSSCIRSSAGTRSSPRTTPRSGSTACSHVPRGVILEKPLYVRIANAVEGGSLFWRLLVVAEPESRFAVIEEYASATPELSSYSNAAVEIVVQQAAKVEYVSVQNHSRGTGTSPPTMRASSGTRSSTGSPAASARRRASADPERPRRAGSDLARDRGLLRRRHAAPRLRHLPGAHGAVHDIRLRVQGRAQGHRAGGLAGDDPGRGGRAEDERVPGEP